MTTDEMADLRKLRYNSTVVHLDQVHPDLMILRVKPDFARPAYLAGQYCALGLGNWEARVDGCQAESLKAEDLSKLVRRLREGRLPDARRAKTRLRPAKASA